MSGGVSIDLTSSGFNQLCGYDVPVPRGLKFLNFFGGDDARTGANQVLGRRRSIVNGEPVVRAGYVSLRGDFDDIITRALEAREMSLLIACRWTVTTKFQNYAVATQIAPAAADPSRNSVGLSLYADGNSGNAITLATGRIVNGAPSGSVTALPAGTDVTRWSVYAVRVSDTFQQIRDMTRGLVAGGPSTFLRDPSALALKIGGGYGGSGTDGRCDVAMVSAAEGTYDTAEEDKMYAWAKPILIARGIPV